MRSGFATLALALLAGCNDPIYLNENRALETTLDSATMTFTADSDLYVLPVRRPSADEQKELATERQTRKLPMAIPWVAEEDFAIEIEYTLENFDAIPVEATFSLNGGNEFGDYIPADFKSTDPNAPLPLPLLGGTPLVLAAKESHSGMFREDEIAEAAVDLEAIVRYPLQDVMTTPFVVIAHNSTVTRDGLQNIPAGDVTPQMVRFYFALSATGNVRADFVIRVRDRSGKLGSAGARGLYVRTDDQIAPAYLDMKAP